jgi:hypothetical protein
MLTTSKVELTSSEVANLWTQYMNDSLAICIHKHMLKTMQDVQSKPVFEYAMHLSERHTERIKQFFTSENYPIPVGFTDEDFDPGTPRLYTDVFYLHYLHNMTVHGMSAYNVALSTSSRSDVRQYYLECNTSSMELYMRLTDVLQSKGLYGRPPHISVPEQVDFVKSQNFIQGWFGERRPLTAVEISNINFNLKKSMMAKALILGFSQVAQLKEVRELLLRMVDVKQKHIEIFSSVLNEDNLPAPSLWDDEVTDSTVPPFSDKLMMCHAGFLFQTALAYYGVGLSTTMRKDVSPHYSRTIAEDLKVMEDWANIMINNGWMEQPPQAEDRQALAMNKKK